MNPQLDDLTINLASVNTDEICKYWMWLLADMKQVLLISKLGDMFVISQDGSVKWLATDRGALIKVANNFTEFDRFLKDDDNIDNWFLPSILKQLSKSGKSLAVNQVYSYKKLPVIGGEYAMYNIEPLDIYAHFGLTGQICAQMQEFPDEKEVQINIVDIQSP